MKKILVIFLVFANYFSQAQLRKGRMVISLNANYNQNSSVSNDTIVEVGQPSKTIQDQNYIGKNLNAGLNFGYFISNKFVVGIVGSFQYSSYINDYTNSNNSSIYKSNNKQTYNLYSSGVYMRYYKMIGKSNFAFFSELNGSYIWGNSLNQYVNATSPNPDQITDKKGKTTGYLVGFKPGITYFINDKFGIEASFGNINYRLQNTKYTKSGIASGNDKTAGTNVSLSLSTLYLGVSYYFGGKKEVNTEPIK
jgi:hypothetical protein